MNIMEERYQLLSLENHRNNIVMNVHRLDEKYFYEIEYTYIIKTSSFLTRLLNFSMKK